MADRLIKLQIDLTKNKKSVSDVQIQAAVYSEEVEIQTDQIEEEKEENI